MLCHLSNTDACKIESRRDGETHVVTYVHAAKACTIRMKKVSDQVCAPLTILSRLVAAASPLLHKVAASSRLPRWSKVTEGTAGETPRLRSSHTGNLTDPGKLPS